MTISIYSIAGASGSGKTTIANKLAEHYKDKGSCHVHIISTDNYYLPASKRTSNNFDSPDVVDLDLLRQHLIDLKNGKSIEVPIYDFTTSDRKSETIKINPSDNDVIILEGIFALNEKIISENGNIPTINLKVYVDTPFDISIVRRIIRDVTERNWSAAQTCEYYLNTMREMLLLHTYSTKKNADLVVDNSSKEHVDEIVQQMIQTAENKKNQPKVSANIYFKFAQDVGYFAFSAAMTLLTAPLKLCDYLFSTIGFHGLSTLGLFQSRPQSSSDERDYSEMNLK